MNRLRLSLRSGLLLASLLLVPALAMGLPDPAKPAATPTPKAAAAAPKAAVPAPTRIGVAPPAAQPTMVNAASNKPVLAGTIVPPAATSPKSVLPPSPPAAPPLPPPPVAAQPAQPAPPQSAPAIDPSRAPKAYILSRYTGELADDELKPISGIFRVTFKLFPDIAAPKEMLFTAYADIERMPQWSPLLESVTIVDSAKRCSEWALRVPRPLASLIRAAGMGQLVRWAAVHETEGCDVLRWQSLSGVKNSGEATFVYRGGGVTTVALRISYELPDLVGPVLSAPFAQRFVRRTMLSTMTRFKEALEAEAASQNRQNAGLGPLK